MSDELKQPELFCEEFRLSKPGFTTIGVKLAGLFKNLRASGFIG
jgi:hypothetical protein